jgi:PleD family two-component response regulator
VGQAFQPAIAGVKVGQAFQPAIAGVKVGQAFQPAILGSTMDHHFKLLLIEDDPAVAHSLQAGLEREGYSVAWKAAGEEGVRYACDHHPHLVILDVRLPDASGFDVCRRMRQVGIG